jgi:hypothetical protein
LSSSRRRVSAGFSFFGGRRRNIPRDHGAGVDTRRQDNVEGTRCPEGHGLLLIRGAALHAHERAFAVGADRIARHD